MQDLPPVITSVDQAVATICLNRAESRNALNQQARGQLLQAVRSANANPNVRVVILTGSGAGFCAGADLSEEVEGMDLDGWGTRQLRDEFNPIVSAIQNADKPFIAAVNGAAAGFGASLALACDLVVMSQDAYLYSAFATIGLIADGGLHKLLSGHIGPKRAFEIITLSQKLNASECVELGLANRAVEPSELSQQAQQLAGNLADAPPLSLRYSKTLLRESVTASVAEIAEREAQLQNYCIRSQDFKEGLNAFFEKRKPRFKGQ